MTNTNADTAHRTATLVYCLWLLGIFFGITAIVAAYVNHTRLESTKETHAYSHLIWQRVAFWTVLIAIVLSVILWPGQAGKISAMAAFGVWLFSGMLGSYYLSKHKRLKFLDRPLRAMEKHNFRRTSKQDQPEELLEEIA